MLAPIEVAEADPAPEAEALGLRFPHPHLVAVQGAQTHQVLLALEAPPLALVLVVPPWQAPVGRYLAVVWVGCHFPEARVK